MTTISTRHPHRAHRAATDHLTHPFEHSPELLIALSALIVVLAGPVARAYAPDNVLVAGGSAVLLAAGMVLAVVAAVRLVRQLD